MKKFLSLVLALVMVMSLVTVSAGADFADQADISYEEAVGVMAGAGIVGGSGGSFYPNSTLSRGAAAKIVAILVLGADGAAKLDAKAAPYSDVPAGSTFAPYIAWAAEKGYVGGYPDGTFRPANPLSGYAFLKMLLGALGYDAAIEGYGGANYGANVAEDAMTKGLLDGISGFVGSVNATREEACQMALNTLKAVRVQYDNKGTNITMENGTSIVVGASAAADLPESNTKRVFMDMYQPKLELVEEQVDAYGRPANTWYYDNEKIDTFATKATLTYTKEVSGHDIYTALKLKTSEASNLNHYSVVTIVENNQAVDNEVANLTIAKDNKADKFGGAGVLTEIFVEKTDGVVTGAKVISVENKIAKITKVGKNGDGDRVITLASKTYKTDDFAKDDYVTYAADASDSNAIEEVFNVVEKQTGKLTKKVGTVLTIGGKEYTLAKGVTYTGDLGDTVDFYLNDYGYIGLIAESEDNTSADVSKLAYVEKVAEDRTPYAVLRFADGSKKTADTDVNYYSANSQNLTNYIVSFSVNADGDYELDLLDDQINTLIKNGSVDFDNTVPMFGTAAVDSETEFLVKVTDAADATKVSFKTYSGYKALPNINGTIDYAYVVEDSAVVFVYAEIVSTDWAESDSELLTVIAFSSDAKVVEEEDIVDYYEVNAVVDGKATVLKVATSALAQLNLYNIVSSYSVDADGIVTNLTEKSGVQSGTQVEVKNNTITFDQNTSYRYGWSEKVAVYVVDTDEVITEIDVADILKDDQANNDTYDDIYSSVVWALDSKGLVTTIVLFEI